MSESRVVVVDNEAQMPELLGSSDGVLREIERSFPRADIMVRGNHISQHRG